MKISKILTILALIAPLCAETVYTIPQGYTKVTIAGSSSVGETRLTAISATLLQDVAFSGAVGIGAFTSAPDPEAPDSQAATVADVTWTATQWTDEPHLAYISLADDAGNADGLPPGEKAFFILGNTVSGGLTLAADSDILVNFPASTTIKIRKANTLSSIFTSGAAGLVGADRVFIWNNEKAGGPGWSSFRYTSAGGGNWIDIENNSAANGMVVYPDEGIFVSRTDTTDVVLTLFGEVPAVPQVASIEGTGFLSSRVPVNTELQNLGIQGASWATGDRVYIWKPVGDMDDPTPRWEAHRYLTAAGGIWLDIVANEVSSNRVIAPDSAVFVDRVAPTATGAGEVTTVLPYDPFAE